MTEADIKKIKVARIKSDKDLLFYTRYMFKKKFNRKFVVNHHHKIISDALERVYSGECKRLMINIAPRYSKTELAVKNFISKGLGLNPSSKYIHLSYSDDLALDNSEEIRDTVLSDHYRQLYLGIEIKKDSKSKKKWYTNQGGGVYATSASGQVTGWGAGKVDDEDEKKDIDDFITDIEQKQGFGGAIIIDDPIKPDDADSDTARDKVNNKFDSTIRNRVNSRNTPIIIIMQRLHPNDLCGYLMDIEPDTWEVISLPCIYMEDGEQKALWPFKHTLEELLKLKLLNKVVFGRQYMQDPQPLEGLIFPNLQFYNYEDFAEVDGITIGYADTADKGIDDFSEPIGKIVDNKFYLRDVIFNKFSLDTNTPLALAKIEEHKMDYLYIETNREGMGVVRDLRDKTPCAVRAFNNFENKIVRIFAQAGFVMNYFVFPRSIPNNPDYDRFLKQIQRMTHATKKDDDAPDSVAGLANQIRRNHFINID